MTLNQDQIDRILKLHDRDYSYRQIADEMGISRTTVMKYVRKHREKESDELQLAKEIVDEVHEFVVDVYHPEGIEIDPQENIYSHADLGTVIDYHLLSEILGTCKEKLSDEEYKSLVDMKEHSVLDYVERCSKSNLLSNRGVDVEELRPEE